MREKIYKPLLIKRYHHSTPEKSRERQWITRKLDILKQKYVDVKNSLFVA